MDISGNNRYELLFMDDDCTDPEQAESAVAKKQQLKTSATNKKSSTIFMKKNGNLEKENKSGALNKNEVFSNKTDAIQVKVKHSSSGNEISKSREGVPCKVVFKSQNNEQKERIIRKSFREGGEFGSEQREARQFKERDIKGPFRNREGMSRSSKREFDRQSGSDKTGVKAIDKREGAGAHNWGSVKQEIDDINKSTTDVDVTLTDKEESSNEQSEQPVAPEEEIKELTLDEWKAMRAERIKPQYNIRKPNEGEDTSQWKEMIVLNKKKEGDSEEEYEYDPSMYPQRVGRLQRIVDIQFNFKDGRRGGGGFNRRRGRGPLSGGDNRELRSDGDKQPRQQRSFNDRQQKRSATNALKVDDERQFPTLN